MTHSSTNTTITDTLIGFFACWHKVCRRYISFPSIYHEHRFDLLDAKNISLRSLHCLKPGYLMLALKQVAAQLVERER